MSRRLPHLVAVAVAALGYACGSDASIAQNGEDAALDVSTADDSDLTINEAGPDVEAGPPLREHDACPDDDAAVLWQDCPKVPCPQGYLCATETGGVAGGGPSRCMRLPLDCFSDPSCECLGNCGCRASFGQHVLEACADPRDDSGVLDCDNGIR